MMNANLVSIKSRYTSVGGLYGDFNVDVSSNCNRYGDRSRKSWNITQGLFSTKLKYKEFHDFTS
ncbi:hypothetical protein GCM10025882_04820 [Acinetobacter gyllenbergii]|nr:hypothetical protein GCM10025882_04820 [Acinetobacter gyllenbergii]